MKFRALIVAMVFVGFLFAGVSYAADGDLVVEGNLGVGTSTPAAKAEIIGNMIVQGNLTTSGSTSLGGNTTVNGNLAVGGTISALNIMTKFYESSEQTWAQSITIAHGLGSVPKFVRVVARCKVPDLGYSVGDEVDITNGGFYNWAYLLTVVNATNVTWLDATTGLSFMRKDNFTFTQNNVTLANWRIVIYASGQ